MHALDNDEEDGEGPSRTSAVPPESDSQQQGLSSLPPLAPGYVRSRAVENDLVKWYSLDRQSQQTLLTGMTVGKRGICHEALVHICVHSFGKKDDRLLQLAFHALTVSAQALILSQAKGFGLGREDRLD